MKKIRLSALVLAVVMLTAVLALGSCGLFGGDEPDNAPCAHTYQNGVCTQCKEFCPHAFAEGICSVCGFVCSHNYPYTEGKCSVCQSPCQHTYEGGVCTRCFTPCSHEYVEGVCKNCAHVDPDYIPLDGGASLYEDIVNDFIEIIKYKRDTEELPPKPNNAPYYTDTLYEIGAMYDPSIDMGYTYTDIDGDGYAELLIMDRGNYIYGLFTLTDKKPAAVQVFQKGMGHLAPDGTVFYVTKEFGETNTVQYSNFKYITRLVDGKLVGTATGWRDADGNIAEDDDVSYHIIDENGVETEVTKAESSEYNAIYNYYWEWASRLTKLCYLKFYSVFTVQTITDVTADFSSYEAIIKTFALMHSDVAGGKYERSKWTSGKYSDGMIFESYEDFEIYDRLIGACVLLQNSSIAKFGYAEKDLDGDGTNELILLGDKYYVYAIFTLVDGKAVLLDSYNDLHAACIDADGNIYVKHKTLPGYEDDVEYLVYKVNGAKLETAVTIGVKHDKSGVATEWYKIVNGEKVSLTADKYNTLYAVYIGDVGAADFHTYTKNNSGLTFIEATAE